MVMTVRFLRNDQISNTGSSRLVRISLLWCFKTIAKIWLIRFYGLFASQTALMVWKLSPSIAWKRSNLSLVSTPWLQTVATVEWQICCWNETDAFALDFSMLAGDRLDHRPGLRCQGLSDEPGLLGIWHCRYRKRICKLHLNIIWSGPHKPLHQSSDGR